MGGEVLDRLVEALRTGEVEVVDLSHPLSGSTPMIDLPEPFQDAPGFTLETVSEYDERGPAWYWNRFEGSEHMGTHFDAPVHWITGRGGRDVSQLPGAELIGPAVVVDRTAEVARDPDYLLGVDDLRGLELPAGGWLIFRTGWSARHEEPERFAPADSSWPGVDVECARWLAEETPLRGFGCEQIGIDAGKAYAFDPIYPMHHFLLGAGKFGLSSLASLERLPAAGAVLVAAPLRIVRGSGSPARVYALVPRG